MSVGILLGVFTVFSLITGYAVVAASGETQALAEFVASFPGREIPVDVRVATFGPMRSLVVAVLLAGYLAALAFLRESHKRPGA
jgi:hypothetical protein